MNPYPDKATVPATTTASLQVSDALLLHQQGDLKAAEKIYRQVLARQPQNHEVMQLLGVLMHQNGRSEIARQLLHMALKLDVTNADYYFNLAEIERDNDNPQAAIDHYRCAIEIEPREADFHFGLGSALCGVEKANEAVVVFHRVIELAPDDIQAHNELGNALLESGKPEQSKSHFKDAIKLQPDFIAARVNLANAEKESGDFEAAISVYHEALRLAPEDADIHYNLALAMDEQGMQREAGDGYRQAIMLNPDFSQAYSNLGRLLLQMNDAGAALKVYNALLVRNMESLTARVGLARALRDLGRFDEAVETCLQALARNPADLPILTLLADCLGKLDRYEEAIGYLDKALEIDGNNAEVHFGRGLCLQSLGQFEAAADCHRRAYDLLPTLTEAAYNLMLIDSHSVDNATLEVLASSSTDSELDSDSQINLQFALAKAYRDRGQKQASFQHLDLGNAIKARQCPFSPENYLNYIERVITTYNQDFFDSRRDFGIQTQLPVFIVGMPRSGSTLVEQIISSHPGVYGAGELNDIRLLNSNLPQILKSSRQDPECVVDLSAEKSRDLASAQLGRLQELGGACERVSDKMLGNFLKLGLITLLFPEAKIIHCLRDPRDMGLSCYSQNFARGLKFTYDQQHIAAAYRGYHKMMQHWYEVLPLPVLDMRYEQLVSDQENMSRRLIEFCELDWDSKCLDFHKHSRGVKTASFWQVRQSLYQSSVGQWRHYEDELYPLLNALGDMAESYDIASV